MMPKNADRDLAKTARMAKILNCGKQTYKKTDKNHFLPLC
jgi:hypothetical protein